jgi:hypothetical protein
MKNSLVALMLSCLLVSAGLYVIVDAWGWAVRFIVSDYAGPTIHLINVQVVGDGDGVGKTVAAIDELKLPNVHVNADVVHSTFLGQLLGFVEIAIYLFFSSAMVFAVFKRVCRWMVIAPVA